MFHRSINIYLVNQSDEVIDTVKKWRYPDNYKIKVLADKKLDVAKLDGANLVIIDVSDANISQVLTDYENNKPKSGRLVICAERKKLGLIIKLFDAKNYFGIWPSSMNAEEFSYYFRGIMDTYKLESELWLNKNYLDATINSIPDLVWYKDKIGAHLKVNESFCAAVGKTMKQVEGRGHYYIWDISADEYAKGEFICMESEYEVMDKKETCIFDESVLIKKELRKLKTYKTPLFDYDGSVMGTVGVAKDVTDELKYKAMVEEKSDYDYLTGAFSRDYVINYLAEEEIDAVAYYVRLSNLQEVNINYGYDKGDAALKDTVSEVMKLMDGIDAFVARLSGCDFAVIRKGKFMDSELRSSAQVVKEGLEELFAADSALSALKVKVGFIRIAGKIEDFDKFIKDAAANIIG